MRVINLEITFISPINNIRIPNRAIFKKSPLLELTKNNLEEKIFNVFDELKRKGGMPHTPNKKTKKPQ
jgi:hypothetical protein